MHRTLSIGAAAVALMFTPIARAEGNKFRDPLDVAALPSPPVGQATLVGGIRTPGGRLVVVGRRGLVLTSDDNGRTWKQSQVPVSTDLLAVAFPSAKQGWAVGHAGVVLHTADGGLTWSRQLDGHTLADLLIAHYQPLATEDSHAKRELQEAERFKASGPGRPLFDVLFNDDLHGIVVGAYNLALRTDDGGRTWAPISHLIDNPQGMHLYNLAKIDGVVWIAGEQGLVLKQESTRRRFTRIETPYAGTYFGITGKTNDVVVFGLRGHALRSRDGGKSWIQINSGTTSNLTSGVTLSNGRIVLASLAGEVLQSTDGGDNFMPLPVKGPMPLYSVSAAGDGTVLLTGARGPWVVGLSANRTSSSDYTSTAPPGSARKNSASEAR